jgi:hypothetical protein
MLSSWSSFPCVQDLDILWEHYHRHDPTEAEGSGAKDGGGVVVVAVVILIVERPANAGVNSGGVLLSSFIVL